MEKVSALNLTNHHPDFMRLDDQSRSSILPAQFKLYLQTLTLFIAVFTTITFQILTSYLKIKTYSSIFT